LICGCPQVEQEIDTCINSSVAKLVEEELNKYVPKDLRDTVDKQRSDLLLLQVEIHNSLSILRFGGAKLNYDSSTNNLPSEARRANSFIKTQKHFNENLHELLDSRGRPSDIFPKTVNDLLGFDGLCGPLRFSLSIAHLYSDRRPQSPPTGEVLWHGQRGP